MTVVADPSQAAVTAGAEDAIAYLMEVSPLMRGCAILDSAGEVLAATGDRDRWASPSRRLLDVADRVATEPAAHAHVATPAGEAFCVSEGGLGAVAVFDRFALASLVFYDLRSALRGLATAGAGGGEG